MKQYITTTKYIVNTRAPRPHIECYHKINNNLYEEKISGEMSSLGEIMCESDMRPQELTDYESIITRVKGVN